MALDVAVVDVEAILAPLPGDSPTGVDMRGDAATTTRYRSLRDARSQARTAERLADGVARDDPAANEDGLRSNWRPVVQLAAHALVETTKDLEIAAWLTEGLVRIAGLDGLGAGGTVIAGLVGNFWDDLFPSPEDGDLESRLAAVKGLDTTLLQALRKLVLFERPDGRPFAVWQYEATLSLVQIDNDARRQQRLDGGVLPYEAVEAEASRMPAAHWTSLRSSVEQAKEAWKAMGEAFNARIDANDEDKERKRVGTLEVVKVLDLMLEVCSRFGTADNSQANPGAAVAATPTFTAAAVPGAQPAAGPVAGREQALQQLDVLADWFKRNEPNSPIGYTLQEAIRRSRMTWPDLIAELVPEGSDRASLLTGVGLKRPDAG